LAVLLVALHFNWSVKLDIIEPLIYWVMTLALLYWRKDKLMVAIKRWKIKHKKTLA
jgi:methionine sulfoxide reductase heme-binding subunit